MDIILDSKLQVGFVLLRKGRQVHVRLGKIDALLGTDFAVVETLDFDGLVVGDIKHFKREDTVVDVDGSTFVNDFGEVLVIDVHDFVVAFRRIYDKSMCDGGEGHCSSVVMVISWPAEMGIS